MTSGPNAQRRTPAWTASVAVAVAAVIVAVVAAAVLAVAGDRAAPHAAPSTGLDAAPLHLDTVTEQVAAHYTAANDQSDLYAEIPCYCGCEEFLAHRHLLDCFVRSDGAGWDAHASTCGVCIAESDAAQRHLADGASTPAIRQAIVDRFDVTPPTTPHQDGGTRT